MKDVLYTISLHPSQDFIITSSQVKTFFNFLSQIGGIIFLFNHIVLFILKPIAYFAFLIQSMQFFFVAKDSS